VRRSLSVTVDPAVELEIRLPDTVVRGAVVDESGQPLPSVVTAHSLDRPDEEAVQDATSPDGEFTLHGLAAGRQVLAAQVSGLPLEADERVVDLREGEALEGVRLVARRQQQVRGRVVSQGAGVPGAQIKAASLHGLIGVAPILRSDAKGEFSLRVSAGTGELGLSVGALGYAFRILKTALPADGAALVVSLERNAGTVKVELPEGERGDSGFAVLRHGGFFESVAYLQPWAAANGGGRTDRIMVVPQLEAGSYDVCWATPAEVPKLMAGHSLGDRCASGSLAIAGELVLKVPAAVR
jgi:hypothetical protein